MLDGKNVLHFSPNISLAKVVFFPTGDTEAGGCQDATAGGGELTSPEEIPLP